MRKQITLFCAVMASSFIMGQSPNPTLQGDYKMAPMTGMKFQEVVKHTREKLQNKAKSLDTKAAHKELKQFERWAYFWQNRVDENGNFPSANEGWKNYLAGQATTKNASTKVGGAWSIAGNVNNPLPNGYAAYPGMGRINVVAVHPSNTNIMYAGAPAGGIWKTIDGGSNWTPKFDTFAGIGISDIVINPSNPNILYAATGDYDGFHVSSIGVYKSTDAGETWTVTGLSAGLETNEYIKSLALHPSNPNTIFALTKSKIKKSTDGGATWTDATGQVYGNHYYRDVIFDPSNADRMIATDIWGGFYLSTNGGASFTQAIAPANTQVHRIALASTPADTNNFYTLEMDGNFKKRRYSDLGEVSTQSVHASFNAQGGYDLTIAVSPTNANNIVVAGVYGWKSTDGGASFTNFLDAYNQYPGASNFYVHPDHHEIQFLSDGVTMIGAHDGGVHRGSFNATSATGWTDLSNGLVITQSYNIAITPQNSDYFMMANQDNDGFAKTMVGGSVQWTSCLAGDGAGTAIDYLDPNYRYLGGTYGQIRKTTDGYATYAGAAILGADQTNAAFISPMVLHPTDPTTLYFGFGRVARGTNMRNATPTLNYIQAAAGSQKCSFIEVAKDGANPVNIYAIGTGWAQKSVDDGANWTDVTSPSGNFTSFSVKSNEIQTVYATVSGYTAGNKVYKSTDGGANWTNISTGLPNIVMNEVIVHQTDADHKLFVGTELGVYYRDNSMSSWQKLGTGLPNVPVRDLKINYSTNELYIGTFGRGMWKLGLATLSTGQESFSLEEGPTVYPNPAIGYLNISFPAHDGKPASYMMYNTIGGIVKSGELTNSENEISLSNVAAGMYMVKITSGNKVAVKKVIIK